MPLSLGPHKAHDLVVIVPSRGRPHAAAELTVAFEETCEADTKLVFAVDADDPTLEDYSQAVFGTDANIGIWEDTPSNSMVAALNACARFWAHDGFAPSAIGFMGDDHRPRTKGWDAAYLTALAERPG